jgi:hypothetical protein
LAQDCFDFAPLPAVQQEVKASLPFSRPKKSAKYFEIFAPKLCLKHHKLC